MPRRRFSQGAIKPIREMLEEIEDEENHQIQLEKDELKQKRLEQQKRSTKKKIKKKHEKKGKRALTKNTKSKSRVLKLDTTIGEDEDSLCNTDDDFQELSREEQLERLKEGDSKCAGKSLYILWRYICLVK